MLKFDPGRERPSGEIHDANETFENWKVRSGTGEVSADMVEEEGIDKGLIGEFVGIGTLSIGEAIVLIRIRTHQARNFASLLAKSFFLRSVLEAYKSVDL